MNSWWRCNEASLRTLHVLLLGQVVSFVLAVSGFTSSFIADLGVDAPLTQSFFTYLCLALVNGSILLYRRQRLQVSWYWYLFLGFIDVQGNYLGGSRPLLGDTLVIAGTLCIAMSNVGEEFCVKKKDRVELMSMLGLFGLLVSVCEISIVELKSLESIEWSTKIVLAFVGFALSNFLFYTLVPFLLKLILDTVEVTAPRLVTISVAKSIQRLNE